MKLLLKQFMAWGIDLKANIFQAARLRLTFYYIVVMVLIVGIFSVVLYGTLVKNIKDNIEESFGNEQIQHQAIEKTTYDLSMTIIFIDGVLMVFIGALSYVLAGKTLKPIARILAAQRRFSADASHDLRTPLAIMQTDIEVTLNNSQSSLAQFKKTLESNLEEIQAMSSIVEDLLLLSRLENQNLQYHFVKIDLSSLVEKIIEKYQAQARAQNITLRLSRKDSGIVCGNPMDLERAFHNILQNALKFTLQGGKIEVEIEMDGEQMKIRFIDTGIGISKKDLPFIFDRFYKASDSRHELGSGLGLSITQEIIQAHRGSITVTSELGKGTTVIIQLPKAA